MGLTAFPHGVSSFGVPVIGAGPYMTTGNVFFVDSGSSLGADSTAHGKSADRPFLTIDFAIGRCTANNGDTIFVMPGHAESLTAAAAVVFDVAGVTVIGLGHGAARPTFTFTTANSADIDVTAANVTIRNCLFVANFLSVAQCFDLDATDFWLDQCEFRDTSASLNFVDVIVVDDTANACDGLKITGCIARCIGTTNDGFLNCTADVDRAIIVGNDLAMLVSTTEPIIEVTGFSLTNVVITHNYFRRAFASAAGAIDSDQTDNSGIVAYNLVAHADSDAAVPIDISGAMTFENYCLGVTDFSGLLLPAVDNNA